ncbi:Leucine Rich Repeat family protein [Trichomonas vaginalis G3]|uniref:Leucine Rich Repeat family protein n=1 Tax=Trichomonas vaginalis (strain ATCC PRA-98 / G3) TaxID=412133 RepID=A2EJ74_TRIV3|nr:uncharacterized protein TVAGG3_0199190 [Trichomonas vaginalis G3]EAY07306.1 Leucine Rich Repeat family protein [Trichomonas vaginalis G3]KAI5550483.1 ribonuclease inhibitor domain-containing protein [Trichomonas vaginalis G3]|eukprot:XP_001319529.1 hypothetical protein [Trichomonas vaginalis G3]
MEEIVLDKMGITSIEPDQLKLFPNLQVLYITNNKLEILNNLEPCIRLLVIDARNNLLSEIDLRKQTFLNALYLANNKFESIENFLKQTANLRNLQILDLRGNEITQNKGYRQAIIEKFPSLEILDGLEVTKAERKKITISRTLPNQKKPLSMLDFLKSLPLSDADSRVLRRADQIRAATQLRLQKEEEERQKIEREQKERFEAFANIKRAPLPDCVGFKREEVIIHKNTSETVRRRSRSRMFIKASTFPESAKDEGTSFFEMMNPTLPKIPTRRYNEAVIFAK